MGSIFKPKMPAPPPIVMPEPVDVPDYADEERDAAAEKEMLAAERKRKGRRSTILTGTGLNEIEDENINKKTLLGQQMLKTIKKLFISKPEKKKIKVKKEEVLILKDEAVDATFENEVKKNNKETKDTKSSLTFGV